MKRFALVLLLVFSSLAPFSVGAQSCYASAANACGSFEGAPAPFAPLLRFYCQFLLTTLCDFEY